MASKIYRYRIKSIDKNQELHVDYSDYVIDLDQESAYGKAKKIEETLLQENHTDIKIDYFEIDYQDYFNIV